MELKPPDPLTPSHLDQPEIIRPRPLRDQVVDALLHRILRGQIPTGEKLNELRLAKELGVSRTPLREALVQLEHAGLVRNQRSHGFVVIPLDIEDVHEVYPIVAELEGLAIKSTPGDALRASAPQLRAITRRMAKRTIDPTEAQQLDDQWHETLLSRCPNRRLLATLRNMKLIVHRYEYAFMSNPDQVAASARQHDSIVDALVEDRLNDAVMLIRQNWLQSVDRILTLMQPSDAP